MSLRIYSLSHGIKSGVSPSDLPYRCRSSVADDRFDDLFWLQSIDTVVLDIVGPVRELLYVLDEEYRHRTKLKRRPLFELLVVSKSQFDGLVNFSIIENIPAWPVSHNLAKTGLGRICAVSNVRRDGLLRHQNALHGQIPFRYRARGGEVSQPSPMIDQVHK